MGFNFLLWYDCIIKYGLKIEITGAKPETEYILMKELDKMGIKRKLQFQMPSVEDVQRHLTDNINAITWAD